MTTGVFIVVTGHGYRLKPEWPFSLRRLSDAVPGTDDSQGIAVLRCGQHDGVPAEHLDVQAGPERASWRIETQLYSVEWPSGFLLESAGEDDPFAPFLLWGKEKSLIWVQAPIPRTRLSNAAQLVGPGQKVEMASRDAVALSYPEEGGQWFQNHRILGLNQESVVVVTSQAPLAYAEETLLAGEQLALSFQASRPRA